MSNPHRISIFLVLLLFLGLIFVGVSDLLSFHEDDFDLSEALVQVQVQTPPPLQFIRRRRTRELPARQQTPHPLL